MNAVNDGCHPVKSQRRGVNKFRLVCSFEEMPFWIHLNTASLQVVCVWMHAHVCVCVWSRSKLPITSLQSASSMLILAKIVLLTCELALIIKLRLFLSIKDKQVPTNKNKNMVTWTTTIQEQITKGFDQSYPWGLCYNLRITQFIKCWPLSQTQLHCQYEYY